MKVFISWSGKRSRTLAQSLRDWIPGVVQAAQPYFSPNDIVKGSRWSTDIASQLAESSIGIICLTQDNLEAPWLMFEAGALAKNLERAKVCPLLFGLEPTDIKGPLVHFQAAPFGRKEMRRVVGMINQELGDAGLTSKVLDSVFDMWWPRLESMVDEVMMDGQGPVGIDRTERDLLEEILSLSRSIAEGRQRSPFVAPAALHDLCKRVYCLANLVRSSGDPDLLSTIEELIQPIRHIAERLCAPQDEALGLIAQAESVMSGINPEEGKAVAGAHTSNNAPVET